VPGWPAWDGLRAGDGGDDVRGPRPAFGEAEPQRSAAAGDAAGDGEEPQAEPLRFPAAGVPGQGEHLRPGQHVASQGHDLGPQLVLGEALQRQVPQPGVLGAADPVFAPGPPAVAEFCASPS
jgi:hypothetical protein